MCWCVCPLVVTYQRGRREREKKPPPSATGDPHGGQDAGDDTHVACVCLLLNIVLFYNDVCVCVANVLVCLSSLLCVCVCVPALRARRVEVWQEPGESLGISIVGGRSVIKRLRNGEELKGIFIKHVLPESPAGRTHALKTGDKILQVSRYQASSTRLVVPA